VYVPWVNRVLLVLIVCAVLGFRSSDNLGSAYGIAVTGTMVITTLLALIVARYQWHWSRLAVAATGIGLLSVDLAFFSANIIKVESGGWFPLALGGVVFALMTTWRRGRALVVREMQQGGLALAPFIVNLRTHPPLRVAGTAVFLTADTGLVPHSLLHNLKHNKVLHERNVLLTVETLDTPLSEPQEQVEWTELADGFVQLCLRFGFGEDPDIPARLTQAGRHGMAFDLMDTTFFISRESIVPGSHRPGMALWRNRIFVFMVRNARPATAFFRIPGNRIIELGAQVAI
jgi:KUP system potassium uptake protein